MNKLKLLTGGFITSLFMFFAANLVFAGGGPVYIDIGSTLSSWSNSEYRQIVAKVHLHPDIPCVGTKVTFKYEDQKDGDKISTGSDGDSYIIQEVGARWLNGKSVYDCGTYAKYFSKNRELKYGIIIFSTPKGEIHERKVALNFQSNEPIISSGDSLPWDSELFPKPSSNPAPSGSIYAKVGAQRYNIGEPKRIVTISWSQVQNAVKYNVYARLADSKDYGAALLGTGSLSGEIGINVALDYYIKVDACSSADSCVSSPEVYIGAAKQESIAIGSPKSSDHPKPTVSPIQKPSTPQTVISPEDNKQVDELNKKVENLQNQLDQSKKTQGVLEQRVNGLVNFIKQIFPFFK